MSAVPLKASYLEMISHPILSIGIAPPDDAGSSTLSGTVDIELGDGTSLTFGPGDVFLAEDVRGQGHRATPHDWVRAYVDV
jgi:hypothetical protein